MAAVLRIFAGELAMSEFIPDVTRPYVRVVTPSGVSGRHLFCAGVLTELDPPGSAGFARGRLADPTGAFELYFPRGADCASGELIVPSFVTVCAKARTPAGSQNPSVVLEPESITCADRAVRDGWVITTAARTLDRLSAGDPPDDPRRKKIASMVAEALRAVQPVPFSQETDSDAPSILIALIKAHGGQRGIPVAELVPLAAGKGLSGEACLRALRKLIEDDQLYQPSAGNVKIL